MLKIETVLVLLSLLIALVAPEFCSSFFERIETRFAALAGRQHLSICVIGIAALGVRAALLPILPIPEPIVHDEFGYLLSADTFAHGRLTNPTHPMWMHFESFHIIHEPSYISKYPAAQGLFLAVGQIIAHPIVGIWLSTVLTCIAVYWMLVAWVPPWLALLGAFIIAVHPAFLLIWGQIYWGGQVAMIGGA